MYLPPLQPVVNPDIRICGDVEIHPTASIAPGVILQATPNSRIIIGIDVCIGMGVIISAYGGVVEIESGATLGSGVLVIGQSKVGSNACIGTATTIFNVAVASMQVIPPGSIIGDVSRQSKTSSVGNSSEKEIAESPQSRQTTINNNHHVLQPENKSISGIDRPFNNKEDILINNTVADNSSDPWKEKDLENINSEPVVDSAVKEIEKNIKANDNGTIGKVYIDQLLVTLFPKKNSFDAKSASDSV